MTNTELIRQEIERRIGAMYNFSSGYSALNVCRELLDFIDSLPKESEKGMKWRTDKPDVIKTTVIDSLKGYNPTILVELDANNYKFGDKLILTIYKENETVTDCHQLDMQTFAKEMSDNIFTLPSSETKNTEESPLQWEYTIARHFAKWGAEHLKK